MENQYTAEMLKKSDAHLLRIVTTDRNAYQSEAVEAAEAEIARRGITAASVEEFKSEQEEQREQEERALAALPLASTGLRFLHMLIDGGAVMGITMFFFIIIIFLSGTTDEGTLNLLFYVAYFFSFFLYYILMEFYFQKTLAKFMTSTKVILQTGEKPTFGDIARRTFCRLIPFDGISFIGTRGWHDSLSGTAVVKDRL